MSRTEEEGVRQSLLLPGEVAQTGETTADLPN